MFFGNGQLATSLSSFFINKQWRVAFVARTKKNMPESCFFIDLDCFMKSSSYSDFAIGIPDLIINTIGNLSISDYEDLVNVNILLSAAINNVAAERFPAVKFIYISSDQVISDENYKDFAITPYGWSKLFGECSCRSDALVIRSAFVGGKNASHVESPGFTNWLIAGLLESRDMPLYTNWYFSPCDISDLFEFIERGFDENLTGAYFLGSDRSISKYSFGKLICQYLKIDPRHIMRTSFFHPGLKDCSMYDFSNLKTDDSRSVRFPVEHVISKVCKDWL